jgi:hypothetical protein
MLFPFELCEKGILEYVAIKVFSYKNTDSPMMVLASSTVKDPPPAPHVALFALTVVYVLCQSAVKALTPVSMVPPPPVPHVALFAFTVE